MRVNLLKLKRVIYKFLKGGSITNLKIHAQGQLVPENGIIARILILKQSLDF